MCDEYDTDGMDQDELDDYSRAMNPEDDYDFDEFEGDHYGNLYED